MFIHMEMLFLNVPYAQIKVILVSVNESILTVMKQIWTQVNRYLQEKMRSLDISSE